MSHVTCHVALSSMNRFHTAQTSPTAGYDPPLAEIRRGRKTLIRAIRVIRG